MLFPFIIVMCIGTIYNVGVVLQYSKETGTAFKIIPGIDYTVQSTGTFYWKIVVTDASSRRIYTSNSTGSVKYNKTLTAFIIQNATTSRYDVYLDDGARIRSATVNVITYGKICVYCNHIHNYMIYIDVLMYPQPLSPCRN